MKKYNLNVNNFKNKELTHHMIKRRKLGVPKLIKKVKVRREISHQDEWP